MERPRHAARAGEVLAAALPVLLTLLVLWPATGFDFVSFDDPAYVTENRVVQRGLDPQGLRWAFNVGHAGNWHPLTWLSHMLDVEWFGLDAGAHHRTSIVLHAYSVLLVFLFLRRLIDADRAAPLPRAAATWAAAIGATLFGVHPLRLESVVWISERKDVLCTTFYLLALLGYLFYVRRGGVRRYLLVVLAAAAALMSKPMAVTLPLVLLLLDVWPLRRTTATPVRLVLEKVPLILLSAGSALLTWSAQRAGGAVTSLSTVPLAARVVNAVVSYASYLGETCWPVALSVFYRYPQRGWSPGRVALSLAALVLLTTLVLWARSRWPWTAVAWSWYLITLLPVIGLVYVGAHCRADRYTYIPHIGLCIGVSCVAAALLARRGVTRILTCLVAVALVGGSMLATARELPFWRNTETLFVRAAETTPGNYLAHYGLAMEMARQGDIEESRAQAELSVAMHPGFVPAYEELGWSLARLGRTAEALTALEHAIRLRPRRGLTYLTLGAVLVDADRAAEGLPILRQGLVLEPGNAEGYTSLGRALEALGEPEQAREAYRRALQLGPAARDGEEARRRLDGLLEPPAPGGAAEAGTDDAGPGSTDER